MAEEVKKIEHKNIYEALSAFQGENPEIKQTKTFGKEGEKMHFTYAPLDEILRTVRPLLSKHGLAVTFGGNKEGKLICSLYHSTYKTKRDESVESEKIAYAEDGETYSSRDKVYGLVEEGVIRSAPITVKRDGDMKAIGTDSTYARRYMLAEVLGIASDEDKDANIEEKSQKNVESFAFTQVEKQLRGLKKATEVEEKLKFLKVELDVAVVGKKAPSLGLKADQYQKLIKIGEEVLAKINGDITIENEDDGSVSPDQIPDLEEGTAGAKVESQVEGHA